MPLYLFCLRSVKGGDIHLEPEAFDDDVAARVEAERSALELAAESLDGRDYIGCWYEVLDERGRRIATVPVNLGSEKTLSARAFFRQDPHGEADFPSADHSIH